MTKLFFKYLNIHFSNEKLNLIVSDGFYMKNVVW